MTVRPILFSAPMVRAILREIEKPGTGKTQTRRVSKHQDWPEEILRRCPRQSAGVPCLPGDILWVREAHYLTDDGHDQYPVYAADDAKVIEHLDNMGRVAGTIPEKIWRTHVKLRPSIHMPRWASRLTLEVTDVRVQRLQDISEEDAKAEGCGLYVPGHGFITHDELNAEPGYSNFLAPRMGVEAIWTEINGPGSWESNPFVVAISFRPHAMNVDTFLAQREAA